jgi:hypothetical protein
MSQRGDAGKLERSGCDHHASCVDATISQEYVETVTRAVFRQGADFSVLAHGSPSADGIVLNQTKNFAVMRETVGIISRVCVARQLERPVRELKAQGVPSFSTPAFT